MRDGHDAQIILELGVARNERNKQRSWHCTLGNIAQRCMMGTTEKKLHDVARATMETKLCGVVWAMTEEKLPGITW